MNAVIGALLSVVACGGIWIAVTGLVGVPVKAEKQMSVDLAGLIRRFGISVVVTIVVWLLTRWPMAGVSAGAVAAMIPLLLDARRQRDADLERLEAIASWAEMLRDTIASHAGLTQAIDITAEVAPLPIRAEVRTLSLRCQRMPLSSALREFAADMDDAAADLIVSALVIADEHQAQNLSGLLGEIAGSSREMASMRLRIEASRARTFASARSMIIITFGIAVGLVTFSPEFLSPYDTATGQLVLGLIGALFAGAVAGLISLSKPEPAPRLLAGIESVRS